MSFGLLEGSIWGGSPIELYEFSLLGQYWRYTTEDRVVTFNGADYAPVAELNSGATRVTQNIERGEKRVRMPGNTPIADEYRVAAPSEPVRLKIYKKHRGDPDFIIRWWGRVQMCEWENDGDYATLLCTQVNYSLKQPGLRRAFQYTCPYVLFGAGCGVDRAAHEVPGVVAAITGLTVQVTFADSYDPNYFAGGYALWEGITGRQDTRMITSSVDDLVVLQNTSVGLSIGDTVLLYPGCDHSPGMCHDTFDNIDNYGGQPFIPTTNPFGGTTIF